MKKIKYTKYKLIFIQLYEKDTFLILQQKENSFVLISSDIFPVLNFFFFKIQIM